MALPWFQNRGGSIQERRGEVGESPTGTGGSPVLPILRTGSEFKNEVANLPQAVELGAGWGHFEFIHPCRVAGARKKIQPIFSNPVGRL